MTRLSVKTAFFLLLATPLCGITTAQAMTDIGKPGELHFSITIKQPTCELVKGNMEVDLGTMFLNHGDHAYQVGHILNKKAFSIDLQDCGDVVRAYVKMDGDPDKTDGSLFALNGGATGVALKVTDALGNQQVPVASGGNEGMVWNLTPNQPNSLAYVASYMVTSSQPTSGTAEAMVNLSISYE